jgi:hypothetical protein
MVDHKSSDDLKSNVKKVGIVTNNPIKLGLISNHKENNNSLFC